MQGGEEDTTVNEEVSLLTHVFIIPYRNREHQRHFFLKYMDYLMEDVDPRTYRILFAHQKNDLPFNRGGVKNSAFLYLKQTYPLTYRDLILIFNDVDTLPYKKNLLNYDLAPRGQVKHYYGFDFTLGGIFAIRAGDFERLDGFPCVWSWGWEDTVMYERAQFAGLTVDRGQFYPMADHHILHLIDDFAKSVSRTAFKDYRTKQLKDGLHNMMKVVFAMNPNDPTMLDITSFDTYQPPSRYTDTVSMILDQIAKPEQIDRNAEPEEVVNRRYAIHNRMKLLLRNN